MRRTQAKIRKMLWKCRQMIDKANNLSELADQIDSAAEKSKTYRELVSVLKMQERILVRAMRRLDRSK